MRLTDYRPTNPFSGIVFAVAVIVTGLAIGAAILGWYVTSALLNIAAVGCFEIVRSLEKRRIRDEDDARQDAIEDAAARARPYEPEGDP